MKQNDCIRRIICVVLLSAGLLCFTKCKSPAGNSATNTLFESLSPGSTGVDFVNTITTGDSVNLLNFEYIYIGGGVGIGDFNIDGLPDIFFVGNMVPSKLYINKGNLKFEDVTHASGIEIKGWPFGVSVADVNGDGLQDIYLSVGGAAGKGEYRNKLFINDGNNKNSIPHFKEQSEDYGLAEPAITIQSVFFDYDRDGDLDMYQMTGGGYDRSPIVPYPIRKDGSAKNTDRLYRNDYDPAKGHPYFTNVSKQAKIQEEGYGLGVSILDINEDGWPDIYVTNDYLSNDLLYINDRNGSFKEMASQYFNHTSHFAMGNDVGDINNDGLMDIIAVDMLPEKRKERMQMLGVNSYDKFYYAQGRGYNSQYMRNTLQLNNGRGKFSEIGQMAGVYKSSWSWAPLFADFDNDGYLDLFVTNGFGKDVTDLDFVKFRTDISAYTNTNDKKAGNDKALLKALDEQPGIKTHPYIYRNNKDNTFEDVSNQWGFTESIYSNGAAYVDLDEDGDLEIITNNIDAPAHIYKNNTNDAGKPLSNNYLRIKLTGLPKNSFATGSTVNLYYKGNRQTRFLSLVRGFESTVEQTLHFGLGKFTAVDSVQIIWPDGDKTVQTNVAANRVLKIKYTDGNLTKPVQKIISTATLFAPILPASVGIDYVDKHKEFIDFNFERLIPRKYSENGQGIAAADVNNDGLEDFFIGGGFQQTGKIYIQNKNGGFLGKPISKYADGCADAGSLFFDADNDGDADLYVVSGGNQFTVGHIRYQDRLYKNNGNGEFTRDTTDLPSIPESGSCVVAADYDKDGDLDLFIGGNIKPGFYPQCSKSYLLRNDNGKFKDVAGDIAAGLQNIGIVTSALWTDFDNDSNIDLVIAGEWMPVSFFRNEGTKFVNVTKQAGLGETDGWWQSLTPGDFDNDGDTDLIGGNWGLNTPYQCSIEKPISICYEDLDKNGTLDPIMSYHEDGYNYPAASLDYISDQMPALKKKFLHYAQYASASTQKVIETFSVKSPPTLYCKTLASALFENKGNGKFVIRQLPQQAQFAPLFGTQVMDLNSDGNLDLVGVGNFYWTDVIIGKYDAMKGIVMLGDGFGNFKPVSLDQSGFIVDSDAKALIRLESGNNRSLFVISQVFDSVRLFSVNESDRFKRIYPKKDETHAVLRINGNKNRKVELSYGSGYLSQSSRSVIITSDVKRATFFDDKKKETRVIDF